MSKEKVICILFTRYPRVGEVKTRLIPSLGAERTTLLHKKMTEYALQQASNAGYRVYIYYTGASEKEMQSWLGPEYTYFKQSEGDLGQRMSAAFAATLKVAEKVLLMGSDCPNNRSCNLKKAVSLLDTASCVLGPSNDGGYYMIGLKVLHEAMFQDIAWGSEKVFAQSIDKAPDYALLPVLNDVDYFADIPAKISVIIPTYNEEKNVAKAIITAKKGFRIEIIVADGGSQDKTVEEAQKHGAKVCLCPPAHRNRASQMNFASEVATGDIVLFLHADSLLPENYDVDVRNILHQEKNILGYFRFAIEEKFFGKKLLEWGTNIRAEKYQQPYGDQGFFLRKVDFEALGRYSSVPILEDIFLVQAAKAFAKQRYNCSGLSYVPKPLYTSGRRWQEHGFLKVTLFNQYILLAAKLGVDLEKLCRAYKKGSIFIS